MEQLINAHSSVRRCLTSGLERWARSSTSSVLKAKAGVQLAICSEIGFGTSRNIDQATSWLKICGTVRNSILPQIESIQRKTTCSYNDPTIQSMVEDGFLPTMDPAHGYRRHLSFENVENIYHIELRDMRFTFKNTHPIIVALSWQLFFILRDRGELDRSHTLLAQMIDDFEEDTEYPADGLELSRARDAFAVILRRRGDFASAKVLAETVLETTETRFGSSHAYTGAALTNLATFFLQEG